MEERRHLQHLSDLQRRVDEWRPWTRTLSEVADSLGVDPSRGLDRLDARNRREHFGPNVPVDLAQQQSLGAVLVGELVQPLMLLLVAVAVLYSTWGDVWDAVTVAIAVAAVIALGAFTEWRAKQALASLRNSVPSNTTVLRDGCEGVVPADDLVPGDVIVLRHGQTVPADAVVALGHALAVDEGVLTGDSQGIRKIALSSASADRTEPTQGSSMPLTLLCAGSTIMAGRAVAVVVATGSHTLVSASGSQYFGLRRPRLGRQPNRELLQPQQRVARAAAALSTIAVTASVVLAIAAVFRGMHWRRAVLAGMSLAFATIPEELPRIARLSLALGSRGLARHRLLVRRVAAADALASVSVIITDKTGTLTRSRLVVSSIVAVTGSSANNGAPGVEVLTPEAVQLSERSAALATPLYAAWSLSVDPFEARPLMRRLADLHRRSTMPQRFGKDFLNSAVLNSLPAATSDDEEDLETGVDCASLPRDPDTGSVPVLAIVEAITAMCGCLTEPVGELPFDPAQRVSARTRVAATAPTSYSQRRQQKQNQSSGPQDNGAAASTSRNRVASKHWTVIKGAPEALVPRCTHMWRAGVSPLELSSEAIRSGTVSGIDPMPESLAQTVSRTATDLAAGGNRVIAYALAITDEPPMFANAVDNTLSMVPAMPEAIATLDVAAQEAITGSPSLGCNLPKDLIFVGAFAFYDPPQSEARPVVQECQDAGIRVILATGDHPSTALAVASTVGIVESHGQISAGIATTSNLQQQQQQQPHQQYAAASASSSLLRGHNQHHGRNHAWHAERLPPLSPSLPLSPYGALGATSPWRRGSPTPGADHICTAAEVHAVTGDMVQRSLAQGSFGLLIDESNVFARVSPAQKLRLVHALQARGEVVAFIGDGINDAPSLTRADVGICMGANPSTADVAMDAAGLIVLSGSFSGVVRSLREGRRLSANAEKCMAFHLACKLALVLLFALLLLGEGTSPMTPVQIIVVKLAADLGATRTFLAAGSEGVVPAARAGEDCASLAALSRAERLFFAAGRKPSVIRTASAYALILFAACALPLLLPSLLLPSWAVAAIAPTMTFLAWMLAHALLGISMCTSLVPLRVSCSRRQQQPCPLLSSRRSSGAGGHSRTHRLPGVLWLASILAVLVLASTIPPLSAHLGVVPLDAAEWAVVIVSPLLMFAGLELVKEVRYHRR
ncbi:hypothetical protein GGI04_004349, partial [Coemansia thaxteri]